MVFWKEQISPFARAVIAQVTACGKLFLIEEVSTIGLKLVLIAKFQSGSGRLAPVDGRNLRPQAVPCDPLVG